MKAKPLTTTFWHNWPPHEIVIRHEVMFTFNPEQWRDVIGCMQKQCRTGSDSGQELSTGLDPLSSAEAAKAFLRNVVDGILNTPSLKIWTRTGAVDYILNVKRGGEFFGAASRILEARQKFGWRSDKTVKQYAKNIGKEKNSRKGYKRAVMKKRKKKRVHDDLKEME